MGNRIEVSLSNRTFGDVTAWKAIGSADRDRTQQRPTSNDLQRKLDYQACPENIQTPQSPTNRTAELNGQLSVLWQQKREGEIAPSYYRIRQKELAKELHAEMERRGHKPIRTKKKHR